MATMDIFNNDAFSLVTMTQEVEKLPKVPSFLGNLGIFDEGEGVDTESVSIEMRGMTLELIPTSARGTEPPMAKTDANARIKAARIAAPRIYIDPTDHSKQRQTGFLGGARLIECLRHYRRGVPLTTGEPGQPVHDQYSHGADAFGAMCEIAEMIVDEGFEDMPVLPAYSNPDPAMGLLG